MTDHGRAQVVGSGGSGSANASATANAVAQAQAMVSHAGLTFEVVHISLDTIQRQYPASGCTFCL